MEPLPSPDLAAEPDGFVVEVAPGDRIHFLDWGGPAEAAAAGAGVADAPGVLLIHGLSNTAWSWTPVARRLRALRRVVAMDLRGHGLSDAPTEGYDPPTFAGDVLAAAEGSGLLAGPADRIVLAGHGFGAIVAAWAAADLGDRCAGLVLVDGGWEALEAASGMDVDEFLRGLDEPPEVLRSMTAFLADRAAFDPASWDADQERAARATVVETHAGKVVPSTRPHALEASVRAMFLYDPVATLAAVRAPVTALAAADDEEGSRAAALAAGVRGAGGRRPRAHPVARVRPRRPQPDALPSGGCLRGDPVGRRGRRGLGARIVRMQVVYSPAHLGHDITLETFMGMPVPANEVAERAELIRVALEADGGFALVAPTEHGEAPITAVHDAGLVRFLEVAWSELRAQGLSRPFLSADTYPEPGDVRGHVPRCRRRAGP